MPRNGSGTYTLPQAAFVSGTTISSSAMNSDLSDIASALTQSVSADGQTPLTGSLKFASGSAGTPGISFASDATTGIYLASAGTLGLAAGGTSVATSTSGTVTFALPAVYSGAVTASAAVSVGTTLAVTGNSTFTGTISDPRGQYTGVLLNTIGASGSTASDTTSLTSSYNWYQIILENLIPSNNGITLAFQVHSGGAFKTTSYLSANMGSAGASGSFGTSTGGMALNSTGGDLANTAAVGLSGFINIYNPSLTSVVKQITLQTTYINTGAASVTWMGGGYWNGGNAAVDGFQISANAGTFTGTIKVYGYV